MTQSRYYYSTRDIAIDLQDVATGARRRLANLRQKPDWNAPTKRWRFEEQTVIWGNHILKEVQYCDVLCY
ncbi:MAG: hypothetical protein JXB30_14785 [Anaerolineae bacterium]|nr:hypothetical protein [Anaerolineae bacterium]